VAPGSWAFQHPRHHLPSPCNTTMPRILALAWVSCESGALLTVVRSVSSIVVYFVLVVRLVSSIVERFVLVVCGPHECSLGALIGPGWMLLPISRQDYQYSFFPEWVTTLCSQHAAKSSIFQQTTVLDPCVASSRRQQHPGCHRRLQERQPRLSRQYDEQQWVMIWVKTFVTKQVIVYMAFHQMLCLDMSLLDSSSLISEPETRVCGLGKTLSSRDNVDDG
jgi:hypothetical protein